MSFGDYKCPSTRTNVSAVNRFLRCLEAKSDILVPALLLCYDLPANCAISMRIRPMLLITVGRTARLCVLENGLLLESLLNLSKRA